MLSAPRRRRRSMHDPDEWWIERRLLARKLLDAGRPPDRLSRRARRRRRRPRRIYRVEHEFTAGWIALRFLNDPSAAAQHFARIGARHHQSDHARARRILAGRAAEAAGRNSEARAHYQAAAQYPTAYYGQIARARLGLSELALRRPPEPAHRAALMNLEVVRAVQTSLRGRRARPGRSRSSPTSPTSAVDAGALVAIAEIARKNDDARAMLLLGKAALDRGFAFDVYAFPTIGIPEFRIVGPPVDKSVVYAIARQESAFNPRAVSSAKALGLMQVLPGTGRHDRQEIRLAVRPEAAAVRSGLQRPDGRRRARRPARGLSRLLHPLLRRLQCRPRPREAVDRDATAIRAIPMSIRSTGSSASRSPRRATTCSA